MVGHNTAGAQSAPQGVGVVVVSWNVRDLLAGCLRSLEQSSVPLRVVVVDNASADGSSDMLRDEFSQVRLIANEANVGFTRANNQGLRALGVEGSAEAPSFALLLNPDTRIEDDAPAVLLEYLVSHPRVGIVGPQLVYADGSVQSSCRRFPSLATAAVESTPIEWHWPRNPVSRAYRMGDGSPPEGQVDWVTGAAMMARTEALAQVGLFDEDFFMYSEELDLCRRLTEAGWEVHFTPRARILHFEAASSDQVVPLRHRRFHRSRVRYFEKHHGVGRALALRAVLSSLFAGEFVLEALKWMAGHKRALRANRMSAYLGVLAGLWCGPDG